MPVNADLTLLEARKLELDVGLSMLQERIAKGEVTPSPKQDIQAVKDVAVAVATSSSAQHNEMSSKSLGSPQSPIKLTITPASHPSLNK